LKIYIAPYQEFLPSCSPVPVTAIGNSVGAAGRTCRNGSIDNRRGATGSQFQIAERDIENARLCLLYGKSWGWVVQLWKEARHWTLRV